MEARSVFGPRGRAGARGLALVAVLGACNGGGSDGGDGGDGGGADGGGAPPFVANCVAQAPPGEAKRTAGAQPDGSVILPGGHRISPAGKVLVVGGFPLAMKVLPGDRYVVVTDGAAGDQALRIVDTRADDPAQVVVDQQLYPASRGQGRTEPGLFYGLALTRDGKRLYASNSGHDPIPGEAGPTHYNTVDVFDLDAGGMGAVGLTRSLFRLTGRGRGRVITGCAPARGPWSSIRRGRLRPA